MEKVRFRTQGAKKGRWCGWLGLIAAGIHLAAFVYVFADCIRFLIQMGMSTLPGLVFATVLTAFDLTAVLLTLRYAWSCAQYGAQDDRVQALYPSLTLALAMHGIYFVLGILTLFLPLFGDFAALQLQVFFGVFFFLLPDIAVMVVLVAVSDSIRIKAARAAGSQPVPAPAPTKAERAERRRALLQAVKGPALWGALAALSIAYIFSGEHSVVSTRTDAFTHFTAAEVGGAPVDESIFAGHDLTLVNIWATFCAPCLGEMPDLARLHEEYKDKGFQVVGVCGDVVDMQTGEIYPDLVAKALELEQQTGADVYLNLNPAGDLMQNYVNPTVAAFPTSLFVDSRGEQVGDMIVGSCDEAHWRQEIEDRLALVGALPAEGSDGE